ncbi:type II secretion system F family protein [Actinoplanes sp. NPDC051851]|uniref:type II secretion system F family protein n=1 Tax=Actinoplanes sp. NPDC051851 TaxID=3154753 RepID=UPI003416D853
MTPAVVLIGAIAGIVAAILLAATAVVLPPPRRDQILRALAVYGAGITVTRTRGNRLGARLRSIARLVLERLGELFTTTADRHRLTRLLDYAGNPPNWPLNRMIRVRPLAAGATCVFAALIGQVLRGGAGAGLGAIVGLVVGFFVPQYLLYNKGVDRQKRLLRSLPDVMDALVIGVEAGLGLDSAMDQVARTMAGPTADEMNRVLQEMRLGVARADALRSMSARTTVRDLKRLVTALVQAGELGISVANILREHAADQRVRRRQRAEELAQKIPVKLIFPVMFCMLPAIFVVLVGPAALQLKDAFSK